MYNTRHCFINNRKNLQIQDPEKHTDRGDNGGKNSSAWDTNSAIGLSSTLRYMNVSTKFIGKYDNAKLVIIIA